MTYALPDLPYDVTALEPHVDARIMALHHDEHHAAYVNKANAALEALAAAREAGDTTAVAPLTRDLAFNASGHVLHSLFWTCMHPEGGGDPEGELLAAVEDGFGSVDALRAQLGAATTSVPGSGWGALVWEPMAGRLLVEQIHDHQHGVVQGALPLLVIDAWEHAFYLQYLNDKAAWVDAFWAVVDWSATAGRLTRARSGDPVVT